MPVWPINPLGAKLAFPSPAHWVRALAGNSRSVPVVPHPGELRTIHSDADLFCCGLVREVELPDVGRAGGFGKGF